MRGELAAWFLHAAALKESRKHDASGSWRGMRRTAAILVVVVRQIILRCYCMMMLSTDSWNECSAWRRNLARPCAPARSELE